MKRILAVLTALVLLIGTTAVCAESASAETAAQRTTKIEAHFASVEEGQQLMRNRTLYHEQINEKNLEFLLQKKDGTLEEYIEFAAEQVQPFEPEDEQLINDTLSWFQEQLEKHGLSLPDPGTVTFVKTSGQEAPGAYGYTSEGTIFITSPIFMVAAEDEARELIVHEIFHCLSRLFPEFRQAMYSLIHFTVLEKDIDIPQEIQDVFVANPDVEHHNSTAVFTINGEKKECYLVFMTDSVFEKAGDSFFNGEYAGVVPVGESVICRADEVEDFWDVVGRNSSYAMDPEEIMAINFYKTILHLDDGLENCPSPEIPEGIVEYLKDSGTEAAPVSFVHATRYDIALKLNPEKDHLEQAVRMELRNDSSAGADCVYLRYYPNGYVPYLVMATRNPENEGKTAGISSVALDGVDGELPLTYDQENTSVRVDLSQHPIGTGESAVLTVKAWTDLPVCNERFGVTVYPEGKLYHLAFTVPYLEYQKDGEWYLDPPQFYEGENRNPDQADYHVTVEAPEEFLVAGPGKVTKEGTETTIDAGGIRDLALFISDSMDYDEFETHGVTIRNYYLKTAWEEDYRTLSKQFITDAFDMLTELLGDYGRDTFVLVEGTQPMEYSGIAEVNHDGSSPDRMPGTYTNTLHEIAHQWFFDGVGNCEFREAWIDEGFTTFLEKAVLALKDNGSVAMLKEKVPGFGGIAELEQEWQDLYGYFSNRYKEEGDQRPSFDQRNYQENAAGVDFSPVGHGFAPGFLYELREIMGEEAFNQFLRDVYQTCRGTVADTDNILAILRKHDNSEKTEQLILYYYGGK